MSSIAWGLSAVLAGLAVSAIEGAEVPSDPGSLGCFVVVTGGELLEGAYPDGHTHFLTRTLRPLGVRCVGAMVVDDVRADMLAALHYATNHAPLVLVTGGLGPTPNDITRETLSEFTGIPLRENESALAELERRFGQSRDQLRANLRRQCLVPERGGFLRNPAGTAVGLIFELGPLTVVALPGPPRELQAMVREELVPHLQARFGIRPFGASLTLRFVGVGQSQITQTLQDEVGVAQDIVVTSLFEGSRVDFTFTARHDSPEDRARLGRLEAELRRRLEPYFYADDGSTLEAVVLRGLRARSVRLVLTEIATGGALATSLHGCPEVRDVLAGAFVAPSTEHLTSLWPAPPTGSPAPLPTEAQDRAWAEAAAKTTHATWSLVIGEGEGERGTGPVRLTLKAGDRWLTHRLTLRGTDASDRAALVTPVLDWLRRQLRELP
jgi:nicotinamide-nucleotide amidase